MYAYIFKYVYVYMYVCIYTYVHIYHRILGKGHICGHHGRDFNQIFNNEEQSQFIV